MYFSVPLWESPHWSTLFNFRISHQHAKISKLPTLQHTFLSTLGLYAILFEHQDSRTGCLRLTIPLIYQVRFSRILHYQISINAINNVHQLSQHVRLLTTSEHVFSVCRNWCVGFVPSSFASLFNTIQMRE